MMLPEGLMVQNVGGSDGTFYSLCISGGEACLAEQKPRSQFQMNLRHWCLKKSGSFFLL